MEINTIHILEYVSEKIPTDSDKIRQFIMHLHFLQYIFRRFAYQFFGILAVCIIQKDCRFLSSLTVLGKHSDLLLEGAYNSWENVYLHVNLQKIAPNSCILKCFTDVSRKFLYFWEIYIFLNVEISMVSCDGFLWYFQPYRGISIIW